MGIHTDIEYCDSSANMEMGCSGCELWIPALKRRKCYAGNIIERLGGSSSGYPLSFDQPKIFPERLEKFLAWSDLSGKKREDKPWLDGQPRIIFLNDMGDTFDKHLDLAYLEPVVEGFAKSPHIILMLTKQVHRMAEFWKGRRVPDNFVLGTSVTSKDTRNRLDQLCAIEARWRYVSYEPAWGFVGLADYLSRKLLHWVIMGGESGDDPKPMHPAWVLRTLQLCQLYGVPFFFKQWGAWVPCEKGVTGPVRYINMEGEEHGLDAGDTVTPMVLAKNKKLAGRKILGREYTELPKFSQQEQQSLWQTTR